MHILQCAHIRAQIHAYGILHRPPIYYLNLPPTHSLRGKEEMSFLRIEYSGMSFASLPLHMQNPALCIHVERHKNGGYNQKCHFPANERASTFICRDQMLSLPLAQTFITNLNRYNEMYDKNIYLWFFGHSCKHFLFNFFFLII